MITGFYNCFYAVTSKFYENPFPRDTITETLNAYIKSYFYKAWNKIRVLFLPADSKSLQSYCAEIWEMKHSNIVCEQIKNLIWPRLIKQIFLKGRLMNPCILLQNNWIDYLLLQQSFCRKNLVLYQKISVEQWYIVYAISNATITKFRRTMKSEDKRTL